MTKVYEGYGKDGFKLNFENVEDFGRFLVEREENTERFSVRGKDLNFITIGDAKNWYRTNEILSERLGADVSLIEDTERNMDMIVVMEEKPYLIGSSAWISIKNRVDIYGKGFDALGSVEQVRDINKILSTMDQDVQVIVVEGKVRAIMSREYSVVRGDELFSQVLNAGVDRFDECSVIEAVTDYNITRCKVVFETLKEELSTLYDLPEVFVPGIIIESSDTGHSGNKIGTFWRNDKGHSFINKEDYIYMKHRGKVSIEKIVDELPNLFLKYQDTVRKFAEMIAIEIENPITTLKAACRQLGITRKDTKILSDNFEINLGGRTTTTAYDICQEILSLSSLVEEEQRVGIEERIGKAVNLNYLKISESV